MAPLPVLGSYYVGVLPFVTGFLYFWTDMSRSATAGVRLAPAAFGMSMLFLWMKTWQAVFARRVTATITGRSSPELTIRCLLATAMNQAIIQPAGLFLLAFSIPVLLPIPWVFAFHQNVTVFGVEERSNPGRAFTRALRQTRLWPAQNVAMLIILLSFAMVVAVNVASGLVAVPALFKMLLGFETTFTRSTWSFLNSTFLATVFLISWLCVDPLIKTLYALRCFYGESIVTGEDLKADLREFAPVSGRAALVAALILMAAAPRIEAAQQLDQSPAAGRPAPAKVSPAELNRSIDEVLQRREFQWRMPREKAAVNEGESKGALARFLDGVLKTVTGWIKTVVRWIDKALDWIMEKLLGRDRRAAGESFTWIGVVRVLIAVLLLVAVIAAGLLLYRMRVCRGVRRDAMVEPLVAIPDLGDENVTAGQLPEDGWLKLARELSARGELRLAIRALYLAGLAHLAQRELISIARFKSNRDYDHELRRRARALTGLQSAFAENVGIFDRVWYGLHEVTQETLQQFELNLERIRTC
jgi:hypothetical protein